MCAQLGIECSEAIVLISMNAVPQDVHVTLTLHAKTPQEASHVHVTLATLVTV